MLSVELPATFRNSLIIDAFKTAGAYNPFSDRTFFPEEIHTQNKIELNSMSESSDIVGVVIRERVLTDMKKFVLWGPREPMITHTSFNLVPIPVAGESSKVNIFAEYESWCPGGQGGYYFIVNAKSLNDLDSITRVVFEIILKRFRDNLVSTQH